MSFKNNSILDNSFFKLFLSPLHLSTNKLVNIEHASNIVEEIEDMENIPDEIKKEIVNNVIYLNDEKYKWMNDLLILHWSGMILKISDYSNWDLDFTDSEGIEHFFSGNNFIVHKDCYEITKQKLKFLLYYEVGLGSMGCACSAWAG